MGDVKSYKDLIVWRKGVALADIIYKATSRFPSDEKFGLTCQIRRAAVSVPSNIAEGYGRNSTRDYVRFLRTAAGSLYEIQTQLIIAGLQGYIAENDKGTMIELCDELEKMLVSMVIKIQAGSNHGRH